MIMIPELPTVLSYLSGPISIRCMGRLSEISPPHGLRRSSALLSVMANLLPGLMIDEDVNVDGTIGPSRLAKLILTSWLPLMLIGSLVGCADSASQADVMKVVDKEGFFQLELTSIRNESFALSQIKARKGTVFVFLDGNCPICQRYASILNQIHQDYQAQDILVVGVFPEPNGPQFSGHSYQDEYGIDFPLLADPDLRLTNRLNATITPEVVVVDGRGEIRYRGAISNWFLGPGEKRAIVTEHYLQDALDRLIAGAELDVTRTKPVGCYIF